MIYTTKQAAGESLDHLGVAIGDALESGVSAKEILTMLLAVASEQETEQPQLPGFPPERQDSVFDELPEGMIDLPTAAEKYGVPKRNLQAWVYRGRLQSYGRLRGSAPGGGLHIVFEAALQAELAKPVTKGGRRRKDPVSLTMNCPECGAVTTIA